MNELSEIIKIKPFNHQLVGAKLALRTFGAGIGGDAVSPLRRGFALLMEMWNRNRKNGNQHFNCRAVISRRQNQ